MLTVTCVCADTGGPGTVISNTASYTLHFASRHVLLFAPHSDLLPYELMIHAHRTELSKYVAYRSRIV